MRRRPGLERIVETLRQLVHRARGGKGRQRRAGDAVQQAHIVQPGDMVGMRVREHHGIDARHPHASKLGAQVGPGIDEDLPPPWRPS